MLSHDSPPGLLVGFVARSTGPHGYAVVGYEVAWEVVESGRTALA